MNKHCNRPMNPQWYSANKDPKSQGLIVEEETGKNIAVTYEHADAKTIIHAVNHHEALVAALAETITAWEDEENSVQEEHAELIAKLNRVYNAATAQ